MFGVEFSHHGDRCTFETLCAMFGIHDRAVDRIGTIVHDLDLKDERYGAPEAATIGALIDGLQLSIADDSALLAQGMGLFRCCTARSPSEARRRESQTAAARSLSM